MSESIEGFSPLQKDLADRIWSMEDQLEIQQFISGLPRNLRREAWVVMTMIIATELDTVMEVEDAVKNYCSSL